MSSVFDQSDNGDGGDEEEEHCESDKERREVLAGKDRLDEGEKKINYRNSERIVSWREGSRT